MPWQVSSVQGSLSVSQGSLLFVAGWEQFPPKHTSRVQIVSSAVQGVSSGFAGWPYLKETWSQVNSPQNMRAPVARWLPGLLIA